MIVRETTPQEAQRVNELFAIAFEQPLENGPADAENGKLHHWAAFSEDGDMMSTFTITDFQIQFDGHACKMGGIGGVATLPQYRRRGGIRGCFEAALPEMYSKGYDFSYLYPFSTAYYRKFGYESCVQKFTVAVHLGLLKPPAVDGAFRLADKNAPLTNAVRAVDQVWEQKYNMMVQHDAEDYGWIKKTDPAVKQVFTYVYFAADGTPKAYTTFRLENQPDGRNLVCSRFCFVDKEGFSGLMQVFKSLSSDHMFVKFSLPVIPAMQYLMPEWSLGAVQFSLQSAGMVRVINVKNALEKAKYIGSGSIVLKINDPQIEENNRTFAITFANGRAASVEETKAAPDAVMEIPTFSALLAGVSDFAAAENWCSGMEIKNKGACFSQVFFRKDLMIADYF